MTFNAALHPRGHVSNPGSFSEVPNSSPELELTERDSSVTAFGLRPHQVAARDDMVKALADNERSLLVSACGTGKTVTLQAIAAERGDDVIGAFFPSLALVDQTFQSWRKQYEGRWEQPVVVCSDTSVGQVSVDDEAVVSPEELRAHGARVVSSPSELAEILSAHDERPAEDRLPLVVFSTYHSSEKVAEAQAISQVYFDLAILDEAHQAGPGTSHGKFVLDPDSILADRRIAATATPKVFHVSGKDADRADDVDMNDESIYGPVGHEYNLRDAIDDGVLVDYEVHIIELSPDDLREALDGNADASDEDMRMAMGVAAYDLMKDDLGITRTIAYLNSRERAGDMVAHVSSLGIEENASIITGDMPMGDRGPLLDSLADDGGLVTNVRCLTEGVDVPRLDAVLFVDPRGQKIDVVQAVGRAIRRHDASGKEKGHVVIPVLAMPDGEDADDWYSGGGFRPVWDTLSQMAANDTKLLSELNRNARERNSDESPAGNHDDDGGSILHVYGRGNRHTEIVADRIRQKASLASVQIADPDWGWKNKAAALGDFHRSHGRWPNGNSSDPVESGLADWRYKQRKAQTDGASVFSAARQVALNDLAPGWATVISTFEGTTDSLAAFHREHGRFPRTSDGGEAAKMARFLERSRGYLTGTRAHREQGARVSYLDRTVPGWRGKDSFSSKVDEVKAFHAKNGHLPTTKGDASPEERQMAAFLEGQRRALAGTRRGGSPEQIAYLSSALPGWEISDREREFQSRVDRIAAFRATHNGTMPSHLATGREERELGTLLKSFRGSKLESRVGYLNQALPGWE